MIVDMLCNEKHNLVVIGLFIGDWNLTMSLVLITQSYFSLLKNLD